MKKISIFFRYRTVLKILLAIITIALGYFIYLFQINKTTIPKQDKKQDQSTEIKRLTDIADVYFDSDKKDSAIYVFNKVVKLCDPEKNTIDYVYAHSCLAEIYLKKSNYIACEESATATLPYLKNIKNPRYSWIVYNILGINYSNIYDYKNAIFYFKKAIKLKSSFWRKRLAINNLVAVYMAHEKFEESIILLKILVSKKDMTKFKDINEGDYSFLMANLGKCYYYLGDRQKALNYYYKALRIRLDPSCSEGLSTTYRDLSLFFRTSNPKLAKVYGILALKTDIKNRAALEQITSLHYIIKCSDGKELKLYTEKYINLSDSLLLARKKAKNQFSNIKYIYKIDKEENLYLKDQKIENELQLERQENRNIISYIIIASILLLVSFLVFDLTLKGKKEKSAAIYQSEMRISKKLHEKLTQHVYDSINFAEIKDLEAPENKEAFLRKLDNLYAETRKISKENSNITTNENYITELKEMIAGFKTPEVTILLNGLDAISWNALDRNKKIILYRVLQELFLNMKKHSMATLVSISFKINGKKVSVIYNDNGAGAAKNEIILKNGLQNVESRIKTINGTIIFDPDSQKGFKLSFTFPI